MIWSATPMAMQMATAIEDPDLDLAQGITPPLLTEERRHDADDERGLHALSQSDDERRQQISVRSQLT